MKTYSIGQRLGSAALAAVLAFVAGAALGAFAPWLQIMVWAIGGLLAVGVLWPAAARRTSAAIGAAMGTAARFFWHPRAT